MTAGFMADCGDLTAEEITSGFSRYRVAGTPYPPSGPELRKHGLDVRADRLDRERANSPALPYPPRGADVYPPEHRAEMQRKFAQLISELKENNEVNNWTPERLSPEEQAKASREALERYQTEGRKPATITISSTLQAQLRGEAPIGQGKLGASPVGQPVEYQEAV